MRVSAEQGDTEAAKELVRIIGESTEALRGLAESGDLTATLLARYADELGLIRSLAESGNYEAAYTLAEEFEDDIYIEKLAESCDWAGCLVERRVLAHAFGREQSFARRGGLLNLLTQPRALQRCT